MPPCGLHARGDIGVAEVDGQADAQLLVLQHPLHVQVHHQVLGRMHLHILDDGFLRLVRHFQLDDGRVELLVVDHRQQLLLIEDQGTRVLTPAVQNGRNFSFDSQAAARTFALRVSEFRADHK